MEPGPPDPTRRFSARADDYARYRPGYPPQILDLFAREIGLTRDWVVADIGSGTGISTKLFLDHGNAVIAVEPNFEMRQIAAAALDRYPRFRCVRGTAEATTLADGSVDLVVAAQAFHWFDPASARREFGRIARPGGIAALIWNTRQTDTTPFARDYEQLLLRFGTDYAAVRHDHMAPEILSRFFGGANHHTATLPNAQRLDFAALRGRLMSSSYTPLAGHNGHATMLVALRDLFDRHQQQGCVIIDYLTEIYWGRLS